MNLKQHLICGCVGIGNENERSESRTELHELREYDDYPALLSDTSASSSANSNISPANKRRSTFRKWLTNPVRKLSHGRLDKAAIEATKANAKKNINSSKAKLLISNDDMGNKSSSPEDQVESKIKSSKMRSQSLDLNGDEDDAGEMLELPPPMQIQERSFPPVNQEDAPLKKERKSDTFSDVDTIAEATPADEGIKSTENDASSPSDNPTESGMSSENLQNADEHERAQAIRKREFVIKELCETEVDYVRDLGSIVEGYMEVMVDRDGEIPMPEDLRGGKDKMVFGNLEQIFEWHKDVFQQELQKCIDEPVKLGVLFPKYARKLHMYERYCQNKPKSEYIVSEFIDTYFEEIRQKLGHKLQLPDLLIKPVQRIVKYQLLLKDIYKLTEKAGLDDELDTLSRAVQVMHVVPKAANDAMNVGRLQGFEGKLSAQGKLIMQDMLLVSEGGSSGSSFKGKDLQVFLFEQIVIFSEVVGKRSQFSNPSYNYKKHIQVNKMALEESAPDGDPQKFVLVSKCPHQQGLAFTIQGSTVEVRNQWVAEIRAILDTQMDFLKALQCPIAYQKELTKET